MDLTIGELHEFAHMEYVMATQLCKRMYNTRTHANMSPIRDIFCLDLLQGFL